MGIVVTIFFTVLSTKRVHDVKWSEQYCQFYPPHGGSPDTLAGISQVLVWFLLCPCRNVTLRINTKCFWLITFYPVLLISPNDSQMLTERFNKSENDVKIACYRVYSNSILTDVRWVRSAVERHSPKYKMIKSPINKIFLYLLLEWWWFRVWNSTINLTAIRGIPFIRIVFIGPVQFQRLVGFEIKWHEYVLVVCSASTLQLRHNVSFATHYLYLYLSCLHPTE